MANPIANVPGSSQLAGTKYPQHVLMVDTDGNPVVGTGGGAATIADGADVTQGALADAKVTGDNSGTHSAKLRGLSYLLNLVTDIANTRLNVFIQNTSLALAAGSALIGKTVGNIDHDGANAAGNNPTMQGYEAIAFGTNPTAVAAGDVTKGYASRHGVPFVHNGHPATKSAVYLSTGAQTDDNVLAAISAGTKYALTGYHIRLDEAATVGVAVRLGFGTANVPALPASGADAVDGLVDYHPGLVPGSGMGQDGLYIVGGDGEELRITCEAPTGGTLTVIARYHTIES